MDLPSAEPETYASQFESIRTRVRQIVLSHGGRVLPGRTRIVRAVFGIPMSFENDVVRAARAALEVVSMDPSLSIVMGHGGLMGSGVDKTGVLILDLSVLVLKFGLSLKFNFTSIIGLASAYYMLRYFR